MINDSPHNGFFSQSRGSVYLRMALLSAVMG
jgi:aspartate carbamoyltransferase catalytic subunit